MRCPCPPLAALVLIVAVLLPAHAADREPAFGLVRFKQPFPAPEFTTGSLDGASVRLADLRGRYVLLNFWATWCPPCLEEMPSMQTLYEAFRERGLVVVAISSDEGGASVVDGFIRKLGVRFPVLLDPDRRVAGAYGAKNLPVTFLLDPQGRVIAAAQGARDWASPQARSAISGLLNTP